MESPVVNPSSNPNLKRRYKSRRYAVIGAVIVAVLLFTVRLAYLQLFNSDYKDWADSNAFLKKTYYPARGAIYDRHDRLLVFNQPAYDVMMILQEVLPFDTTDFCNILNISRSAFLKRVEDIKNRNLNPGYSAYTPQVFTTQLSPSEYGVLQEKLYKFPGFYLQNRVLRQYGYPNAALLLGNIGEVDKKDLEEDKYYTQGDRAGRSGIEKSYEHVLRGQKGVEILLRDARGRIKGKYDDGKHDEAPVSGKNLKLSVDIELQAYAERLMQNKTGSVVMIEPSTGEVLCLVSAPSYDPALLVGRQRGRNHAMLEENPLKPLFDRSIMGTYSPGSTYKPAQGLVFLQEGVITPQKQYTCSYGYPLGSGKPRCHRHYSPLNVVEALTTSCNAFFCWGLHDMLDNRKRYLTIQEAFDTWKDHMVSMGYGYPLGIDLPGEKRGFIPNSKVYNSYYRTYWSSSTIISIAIGQGEVTATPLQICNLAATIANRGYFITPHVVKEIDDYPLDTVYTHPRYTSIDTAHYSVVAAGMRGAVLGGTCWALNMPGVEVCGKTGTVENSHGKDHSACISFAPYNDPQIAICVFIENGGFGATNAIPVARLMLEKFFYGSIQPESLATEERVLNTIITPY